MKESALSGVRILDLSRVLAGPYCTMVLSDLGAEVIKVEAPGQGDGTRQWGPPWVGEGTENQQSAYYMSVNRNKKSLTLNLKHPEGQGVLKALAADSDVLVENFKVGGLSQLGLGYEHLSGANPGLIYCSLTGYGQTGPFRERPGYDFVIQAEGGIMSVTGPVDGEPHKVGVAIVDITAGLFASIAILAALRHREKTGKGQHIDLALLDTQVAWLANVAHNFFAEGRTPARYGNAHPNIVPYEIFQTADGYLALGVGNDPQFEKLTKTLRRPDLWSDVRFQTNAGRVEHRDELIVSLQREFLAQPTQYWIDLLVEYGIPVGPVNDIPSVMEHPQIIARDMLQTVVHPVLGEQLQLGPVPKMSETPPRIRSAPPLLGEHTEQILRQDLGYSLDEIERLRREQVI